MTNFADHEALEAAICNLLNTPELLEQLDRRSRYDLLNRDKRNVTTGRLLEMLFQAGLIDFKLEKWPTEQN